MSAAFLPMLPFHLSSEPQPMLGWFQCVCPATLSCRFSFMSRSFTLASNNLWIKFTASYLESFCGFWPVQYTRWIKCKIRQDRNLQLKSSSIICSRYYFLCHLESAQLRALIVLGWPAVSNCCVPFYMPWNFLWVDLFDSLSHLRLGRPTLAIHVPWAVTLNIRMWHTDVAR
jgi:hypothetical protein